MVSSNYMGLPMAARSQPQSCTASETEIRLRVPTVDDLGMEREIRESQREIREVVLSGVREVGMHSQARRIVAGLRRSVLGRSANGSFFHGVLRFRFHSCFQGLRKRVAYLGAATYSGTRSWKSRISSVAEHGPVLRVVMKLQGGENA
jgi:hypothetical protein